ncbi:Putative MetA-pathway of phenol degradation [Ekhidna lutea]|uniref:Putative MetA-pathway of phenol degradation n=1 Tax=Ekhidna lutea TaxID=447679 RepID=A0A239H9N9_EKHLU|nr:transporter [Ekhidna lutea]SNS77865.1 Putative MetA-pathway of phenol degradation [Ekhidna lutea]
MKKLLVLLFVLGTGVSMAQDSDPIVTDRPTQSAATSVVSQGNFILEYGFLRETLVDDVFNNTYANFHLRYGVIDGVELRVTQNYVGFKNNIDDTSESGLSPLTLGTKVYLLEENGAVPEISVIGQVTLANGDNMFKPSRAIPEIRFNFANALSDKFSLGYNLGMSFPEDQSTSFYTAVLGYALADGWTLFAEPYGFFYDGNADHRFNTGIIFLAKNRLQFDVSAGWGLSDISPDSFVGFGASFGF